MGILDYFRQSPQTDPPADQSEFDHARNFSDPGLGFSDLGFSLDEQRSAMPTGPAAIAIKAISERLSGLELEVLEVRRVAGVDEEIPEPDHPLQMLLDNPTSAAGVSVFSASDILGIVTSQILSFGESYLLIVRSNLGLPLELWPQSPGTISPKISNGRVTGYESNQNGILKTLDPEDVVRVFNPDPSSPWKGRAVLADHLTDYETDVFLRQHVRKRFQNDAAPRTVLETADGNESLPNPDELRSFNAAWRSAMSSRHGTNAGGVSIVKPGWSAKSLDGSTDYSNLVHILEHSQRTLFHAFGMPETIVGASESINRATVEASQHIFDTYCISPMTVKIAEAFTSQLARLYPVSESTFIKVRFRKFVEPDRAAQLAEDQADAASGIRSINEIRSDRGYQAPDSEWGELPIQPSSNRPFDGQEPPSASPFVGSPVRQDKAPGPTAAEVQARFSPELELEREERRVARWLSPFSSKMRSIFAIEKTAILKAFKEEKFQDLLLQRQQGAGKKRSADDKPNFDYALKIVDENLFPPREFASLYAQKLSPVYEKMWLDAGREALDILDSPRLFSMTERAVAGLVDEEVALYRFTSDTTRRQIAENLAESITEGRGAKEAGRSLRKHLDDVTFSPARCEMIAKTEIASTTNAARLEGFAESDMVAGTVWRNSMDRSVRESHLIEGQYAANGQRFTLGSGASARFPGDPSLPAADRINCRCSAAPVLHGEDIWSMNLKQAEAGQVGQSPDASISLSEAAKKMMSKN